MLTLEEKKEVGDVIKDGENEITIKLSSQFI